MAKAVIGPVRFSYLNLFEPVDRNNSGNPKYSLTLLIDKNDKKSVEKINKAIHDAKQEGLKKKFNGTMPAKVPNPVHDGDGTRENGEPFGQECKGHYVMTATANEKYPPGVVAGRDGHQAMPNELYSGCYGYVSLNFSAYNYNGKKGVGAYLNNVWKTKDGEPLAGARSTPENDFKEIDVNEIDFGEEEMDLFDELEEDDELPF